MTTTTITSGQSSSGLTVSSGSTLTVLSGGTVTSTAVLSSGLETLSGGTDFSANVASGGRLVVSTGGLASGTAVLGSALVASGGVGSGVSDYGALTVSGGTVVGTTVAAGAVETLSGVYQVLPVSGVYTNVLVAAGVATATSVLGGTIYVYSGGVDSGAVLANTPASPGATARETLRGGVAIGTTVSNNTVQQLTHATTTGTVVSGGGEQLIDSQSVALDTTIIAGGVVSNGGTLGYIEALGVTSTLSGTLIGGGTLVQSGPGTLIIGATVSGFTGTMDILGGTLELPSAGAAGIGAILFDPLGSGTLALDGQSGPAVTISRFVSGDVIDLNGVAFAGTVAPVVAGNTVSVTEGGVTDVLTIANAAAGSFTLGDDGHGGTSLTNAAARPPIVSSGTTLTVSSGQTSSGLVVLSGGALTVLSGGTAIQVAINTSATENLRGTDSGAVVGGNQYVSSGGLALNTSLTAGGQQVVGNGGSAMGTIVGGSLSVASGGTVTSAVISGFSSVSGGTLISSVVAANQGLSIEGQTTFTFSPTFSETLNQTGVGIGTMVSGGGGISLYLGGITSGTVLLTSASGTSFGAATETVSSAGSAVATKIGTGDYQTIYSGGTATGTIVSSGGFEVISGGIALNDAVASGGSILDGGTAAFTEAAGITTAYSGSLSGSGSLVQSGSGTLKLAGTLSAFSGTATISGGTLELSSAGAAGSSTIVFGGAATLKLDGVTPPVNTISGFALGDKIDLAGLPFVSGGTASGTGNSLKITEGTKSETLAVFGAGAETFRLVADGAGTDVSVACYTRGTLILTASGELPVEALQIGDLVVTASGGSEPIRWIGRRSYAGRFLARQPNLLPVRIRQGALGGGLPRRDLIVSPAHAMLIDGWLVPAAELVNGCSIVREAGLGQVDYFHVELAQHQAIWAEGAASETFLDDDSRAMFHNALEYAVLYPDASSTGRFCAPRIQDGYELEAIRRKLHIAASLLHRAA